MSGLKRRLHDGGPPTLQQRALRWLALADAYCAARTGSAYLDASNRSWVLLRAELQLATDWLSEADEFEAGDPLLLQGLGGLLKRVLRSLDPHRPDFLLREGVALWALVLRRAQPHGGR
jgi:hypothetical protein